jgi:hypothetical protein
LRPVPSFFGCAKAREQNKTDQSRGIPCAAE